MPQGVRVRPEAAYAEDCDSEGNTIEATARVSAKRRAASVKAPKAVVRHNDPGVQAGYTYVSSTSSQHRGPATTATNPQQANKAKPIVIQRSDSKSERPRPPSRSASLSQGAGQCGDPACFDPQCAGARQYTTQQQHYHPVQQDYYHGLSHSPVFLQAPHVAPTHTPQARPRRSSNSGARPVSIHGYPSGSYAVPAAGPPPSASAWHNIYAAYPFQQPLAAHYGTTPPTPPAYPPYQSSIPPSPTSPIHTTIPALSRTYSARTTEPLSYYDAPKVSARANTSQPRSVRHSSTRRIPGAFEDSGSDSDYSTASQESEGVIRDRHRKALKAERDAKQMPPPLRPSLSKRYTTPALLTSAPREEYHRSVHSDFDRHRYVEAADHLYRPETGLARTSSSYSSNSRRPSVSTTASSGRTKATTVSNGSGSHRVILEDRHGRPIEYRSKHDRDALRRMQQLNLQDTAEEYQNRTNGAAPIELTAESIQRMKKAERRTSGSHMSGHSRRSGHSSRGSRSEGIKIQTGETVLHVNGDATVSIEAGENGQATRVIINAAPDGKESMYHGGSKSSGSRQGRSRGISEARRAWVDDKRM